MKTLDEILENVTAGGQWEASNIDVLVTGLPVAPNSYANHADAAYAAWAARHAPALIRALDLMIYAPDSAEAMRVARNAMAEAFKD